jgi:hypothetical protein
MKILGVVILVLAIAIAAIPQFTTCESQGKMLILTSGKTVPMKCSWTARSEIAVAVPLFAVGAMMIPGRRKESQFFLSIFGVVLGIFAVLLPTKLIGVCSSNMLCNTVMKPSLLALGSVTILMGLIGIVINRNRKEL